MTKHGKTEREHNLPTLLYLLQQTRCISRESYVSSLLFLRNPENLQDSGTILGSSSSDFTIAITVANLLVPTYGIIVLSE
jgi:hypothetical protein